MNNVLTDSPVTRGPLRSRVTPWSAHLRLLFTPPSVHTSYITAWQTRGVSSVSDIEDAAAPLVTRFPGKKASDVLMIDDGGVSINARFSLKPSVTAPKYQHPRLVLILQVVKDKKDQRVAVCVLEVIVVGSGPSGSAAAGSGPSATDNGKAAAAVPVDHDGKSDAGREKPPPRKRQKTLSDFSPSKPGKVEGGAAEKVIGKWKKCGTLFIVMIP